MKFDLTTHDSISQPSNPRHGSRRGLACMVGATIGWVIGALLFVLTKNVIWLVLPPAVGIFLGYTFGYQFFPRE